MSLSVTRDAHDWFSKNSLLDLLLARMLWDLFWSILHDLATRVTHCPAWLISGTGSLCVSDEAACSVSLRFDIFETLFFKLIIKLVVSHELKHKCN